jgi:hypothetical protein
LKRLASFARAAVNCLRELGLEALVVPASVVRTRRTLHGLADADVETAWAFLESEPASTDGDFEPSELFMTYQRNSSLRVKYTEKVIYHSQRRFYIIRKSIHKWFLCQEEVNMDTIHSLGKKFVKAVAYRS